MGKGLGGGCVRCRKVLSEGPSHFGSLGPWPLSLILSCDSGFMINVFMNSLLLHIIVLFASVQRIIIFFSYTQQTIMDGDIPKCSSPRCTVSNKAINWQLKCV